jgi:hypothetical protein
MKNLAAALTVMLGLEMLTGCSLGTTAATVVTDALLTPAQVAGIASVCQASAPLITAAGSAGLPASITQADSYLAAYCAGVSGTGSTATLPATTASTTPSWLSALITGIEDAGKVVGVVLPLVAAF